MKAFALALALCLWAMPAFAQDAAPAAAQEQTDMGDLQHRVELATQMHQFRPAREQVDAAIEQVAEHVAPDQREAFKTKMRDVLNCKAIEKISIDAMAETFSEKELEVMVDYYSKPEARSISDKYPQYQAKVSPEIVKMMDKAMMQAKTGAPGQ